MAGIVKKAALVAVSACALSTKKVYDNGKLAPQNENLKVNYDYRYNEDIDSAKLSVTDKSFDLSYLAMSSIVGFIAGISINGPARWFISSYLLYSLCKNFPFQSQDCSIQEKQIKSPFQRYSDVYPSFQQWFTILPNKVLEFFTNQVPSEYKVAITIGMVVSNLVPCSKLQPVLYCIPFLPDKLKAFLPFSTASSAGEYGLLRNEEFCGYMKEKLGDLLPTLEILGENIDLSHIHTNWDY